MALEKATITNLHTREMIPVMFNPAEYSLDAGNSFAEIGIPGLSAPPLQYVRGNSQQLRMELFFDTTNPRRDGGQATTSRDVRQETVRITSLLDQDPDLKAPPPLLFAWGKFNFRCVLESVSQRFTLFLSSGEPVRATLTVSFKQYAALDVDVRVKGGMEPPALRQVFAGDTLSAIAGEVLGDPRAWRQIAELNNIDDPFDLPPGRQLQLPIRQIITGL